MIDGVEYADDEVQGKVKEAAREVRGGTQSLREALEALGLDCAGLSSEGKQVLKGKEVARPDDPAPSSSRASTSVTPRARSRSTSTAAGCARTSAMLLALLLPLMCLGSPRGSEFQGGRPVALPPAPCGRAQRHLLFRLVRGCAVPCPQPFSGETQRHQLFRSVRGCARAAAEPATAAEHTCQAGMPNLGFHPDQVSRAVITLLRHGKVDRERIISQREMEEYEGWLRCWVRSSTGSARSTTTR